MLPGNARVRHPLVERMLARLSEAGSAMAINRLEMRDASIGIITSGVCYQYVREVLPNASTLKLGLINPLPESLIRNFAARVDTLYVVEELDPFIETQVKAMGIKAVGKDIISLCGELTPGRLRTAFGLPQATETPPEKLPGRPPNMCPGCPHRGVFYALNQLKA